MVEKKQDGDVLTASDFNFVLDFVQSSIDNHALFREKIARHDFIENLDELAYQGGFYDIFRDTSKIESSSNVVISTLSDGDNEGKVQIERKFKAVGVDDFEDGDITNDPTWSNHNSQGGDEGVSTSTVKNGSYSGFVDNGDGTTTNGIETSIVNMSEYEEGTSFQTWIRKEGENQNSFFMICERSGEDGNGENNIVFEFYNGQITVDVYDSGGSRIDDATLYGSFSTSNWYKIEVDFFDSNGTFDARVKDVDGNILNELTGLQYNGFNRNYINFYHNNTFDRAATLYFDDVSYDASETIGDYYSSGSIIEREDLSSGDDNFSNPPVSVTVNQDADIPADEDIQYIVKDVNGSGTDTTVTQSEVGTRVDISDFTGFLIEVKTKYTTSDGADTPTHRSQDFYFKEG